MNRTIKDATVKRYHYDDHHQLRTHLNDFISAYNFARRLKTLKGLTPYEYICKIWTNEPERFRLDQLHQMPGLNSKCFRHFRPRLVLKTKPVSHQTNSGTRWSVVPPCCMLSR